MGYFDALTSSYFKTGQDGRRLFFPWGVLGRGYVIASEQDYERLRRQVKAYTVVSLVLIVGAVAFRGILEGLLVAGLLILFYLAWMGYLLRSMQPSDERLTLTESMTSQARSHGAVVLWSLEVVALLFIAIGIVMLVVDPGEWMIALAGIVFFGLCAAVFTRMLILRHRTSGPGH